MSSEIVPGVDTMALAERAWHGYGTVVGRNMTYNEALGHRRAGLDRPPRPAHRDHPDRGRARSTPTGPPTAPTPARCSASSAPTTSRTSPPSSSSWPA